MASYARCTECGSIDLLGTECEGCGQERLYQDRVAVGYRPQPVEDIRTASWALEYTNLPTEV